MSVLGRLLVSSGERIDLPDFLAGDSFNAGDWKFFIKSLCGDDKPYILKGFEVVDPPQSIGGANISIKVANSVVYYAGSNAGSFFYGLPEGNTLAQPLIPSLKKNAINYVYLTFTTTNSGRDVRAFWDVDLNGGEGAEFTQDVDTESVLTIDVNVSTASFPTNTIPICKVTVDANYITEIEDCRDLLFRLGTGGLLADPNNRYNFRSLPTATYKRDEPSAIMTNALDPNGFQGGDKNLYTLKEWMDVVMTKLAELGGTQYWYEAVGGGANANLIDLLQNANMVMSVKDDIYFTPSTSTLTFLNNIEIMHPEKAWNYTIPAQSIAAIADGEILYVTLDRTGTATTLPVFKVAHGSYPLQMDNYIIGYRRGDKFFLRDGQEITYVWTNVTNLLQDKNYILSIPSAEFDSVTGTLTWSSSMEILSPEESWTYIVNSGTLSGIANHDVLYVNLDRTGVSPVLVMQRVAQGSFALNNNSFVIGYRRGNDFILRNGIAITTVNIYDESILTFADIDVGDSIALPPNSRNGNAVKSYKSGRAEIEFNINGVIQQRNKLIISNLFTPASYDDITGFVYVDDLADLSNVSKGCFFKDSSNSEFFIEGEVSDTIGSKKFRIGTSLIVDTTGDGLVYSQDFAEDGVLGSWVSTITARKFIPAGSTLTFRIMPLTALGGGSAGGGGGGGGTMQDAYNMGRTITTLAGSPMEISGPSGSKLLKVNGDMDVSGVIDPKGITFTPQTVDPLGGQSGLWFTNAGQLMFTNTITSEVSMITGAASATGIYTNDSGTAMVKGRVIRKSGATTIRYANWLSFSSAAVMGILIDNTANGAVGQFQRYGWISSSKLNAACFVENQLPNEGDWVFLAAQDGQMTITPPAEASGFVQVFMGTWDNNGLNLNITPWGVA